MAKLKGKPVLLILGAGDQGLPATRMEPFLKAMESPGPPALMRVYPGAGHAFMRPDPPKSKTKGYNAEADKEARAEIANFLKKHL